MSEIDVQKYYEALISAFNDPEELNKAIDLKKLGALGINEINSIPELHRFFGGEEDSWGEFLQRGLSSLRNGFYKICGQPFYNTNIFPNTFSADVYYFHIENDRLIKYQANIGPMTNVHAMYYPILGTLNVENVVLRNNFIHERNTIGTQENHYLVPKKNFYNKVFMQNKIFYIIESIFDPAFPDANPKPKKVTWSFIDF